MSALLSASADGAGGTAALLLTLAVYLGLVHLCVKERSE